MEISKLGTKIVVLGVSAAGKSTFARSLAKKTFIPIMHMDMHMWQPGWNYVGNEATVAIIKEAAKRDRWIIEGYIEKEAREELFDRADTILYLDYPAWLPALRYIKRWWTHRNNPRPELPGCPEKFSFEFLIRVYKKKEVYRLEQLFKSGKWDNKIIKFKTPKEAELFLTTLS